MRFSNFFNFKIIHTLATILLSSCAQESSTFSDFDDSTKLDTYKVVNIFFIKNNIYRKSCDISGNKLMMKLFKKEKKWKRSKYISKGCAFNFAQLN